MSPRRNASPLLPWPKGSVGGAARYPALARFAAPRTRLHAPAAGVVSALDRRRLGQAYVVCGTNMRLRQALAIAAEAGGRRLPRLAIPNGLLRATARLLPDGGRLLGLGPNLRELVRASDGVTYWANHGKATAELGYAPRDLGTGARDAFGSA